MAVLYLILDGPMQSWGTHSRFNLRDTMAEPTKSGVVGLLAAARGIGREDADGIRQLAQLRMGVRVDREGVEQSDYQTASDVFAASSKNAERETVTTQRAYLAEARFVVALEGERSRLEELYSALRQPRWPLYLGRRGYLPARPVVGPDPAHALSGLPLEQALVAHRWVGETPRAERPDRLRTVIDTDPMDIAAELRYDHPVSFAEHDRRYTARYVRTVYIAAPST